MHRTQPLSQRPGCFLCDPEPELTWLESPNFRAVLGLGPVSDGYTLIATREHLSSTMDLSPDLAEELDWFSKLVRARLAGPFGQAVVAEHGRVSACVGPALRRHEPHCLHAHRLVFPGVRSLSLSAAAPLLEVHHFDTYSTALAQFKWPGQYLLVEGVDGAVQIAPISGPLPRQFLRAVVARGRGLPHLADWRAFPGYQELEATRARLVDVA